ncbi:MAG: sirohydrochlorin cobaltochelatase [Bacteroidaceae bacterium]|nr:sirohydrochlorin cobaltochelatase [Bacteroidaceae bacterium]
MMKRFFFLLLLCVTLQVNAQQKKGAILVAQFGTSYDEGRKASLDVLFNVIKNAYPEYEVREAFTSPRIRKALEKKGIHKDSAEEALLRLKLEGYENVIVQPTFLMDGVEMSLLREDVNKVSPFFKEIKVGIPILNSVEDFKAMTAILKERQTAKNELVMYVGHGNEFSSNAVYSMLGNMLRNDGQTNIFIGTIEGWPDLETSVNQLKGLKAKKVTLIPFLLASGVHAHEDIDGEWRPAIETLGYNVEVHFHGLGENEKVQQLVLKHLNELSN